jgi:hypothetical protein
MREVDGDSGINRKLFVASGNGHPRCFSSCLNSSSASPPILHSAEGGLAYVGCEFG